MDAESVWTSVPTSDVDGLRHEVRANGSAVAASARNESLDSGSDSVGSPQQSGRRGPSRTLSCAGVSDGGRRGGGCRGGRVRDLNMVGMDRFSMRTGARLRIADPIGRYQVGSKPSIDKRRWAPDAHP
jgi:hypothetical protein